MLNICISSCVLHLQIEDFSRIFGSVRCLTLTAVLKLTVNVTLWLYKRKHVYILWLFIAYFHWIRSIVIAVYKYNKIVVKEVIMDVHADYWSEIS